MMSQSRARKSQNIAETVSKARAAIVKASGDSDPRGNQKQDQSNKSKNKIPKSIRYDLENALVGLCDVWFEDIKPHLVRNKIKLHVDRNKATASGDFSRLPPAAPGCSHLDPGADSDRLQQASANSVVCCSTQQTASKALCRRPLALRLPPSRHHHPASPPTLPDLTSPNKTTKRKTLRARSRKKPPQRERPNWRVPRLCRTYSRLAPIAPATRIRRVHTASPVHNTRQDSCLLSFVPCRRTNMRSKHTQTEITANYYPKYRSTKKKLDAKPANINAMPLRNRHQRQMHRNNVVPLKMSMDPVQHLGLEKRSYVESSSVHSSKMTCSVKPQNKGVTYTKTRRDNPEKGIEKKEKKSLISPRKSRVKKRPTIDPSIAPSPRDHSHEKQSRKEVKPVFPSVNRNQVMQPNESRFWRCFATTNLNLKNNDQECRQNNQKHQWKDTPSMLYDKDLIEIIAHKHDKRLRVLYKSPNREQFPSLMNLVISPSDPKRASSYSKKIIPWR